MAKKNVQLIPPDYERCQAERLGGSFMTLGPRKMERCKRPPVFIATEIKPGEDGQCGSMSLCAQCSKMLTKKHGPNFAKLMTLEEFYHA